MIAGFFTGWSMAQQRHELTSSGLRSEHEQIVVLRGNGPDEEVTAMIGIDATQDQLTADRAPHRMRVGSAK
jgi:hypothetical protein